MPTTTNLGLEKLSGADAQNAFPASYNATLEVLDDLFNAGSVSYSGLNSIYLGSSTTVQSAVDALDGKIDDLYSAIGAEASARLSADQLLSPLLEVVNTVAASGAAQTLPVTATIHNITLTANCTLTFPTVAAGRSFTLLLRQDATGSRTVTWPGTVRWPNNTAPTLTTTATRADLLTFVSVDGTNWLGRTLGLAYT